MKSIEKYFALIKLLIRVSIFRNPINMSTSISPQLRVLLLPTIYKITNSAKLPNNIYNIICIN